MISTCPTCVKLAQLIVENNEGNIGAASFIAILEMAQDILKHSGEHNQQTLHHNDDAESLVRSFKR